MIEAASWRQAKLSWRNVSSDMPANMRRGVGHSDRHRLTDCMVLLNGRDAYLIRNNHDYHI